jgi:hypothetical protein
LQVFALPRQSITISPEASKPPPEPVLPGTSVEPVLLRAFAVLVTVGVGEGVGDVLRLQILSNAVHPTADSEIASARAMPIAFFIL